MFIPYHQQKRVACDQLETGLSFPAAAIRERLKLMHKNGSKNKLYRKTIADASRFYRLGLQSRFLATWGRIIQYSRLYGLPLPMFTDPRNLPGIVGPNPLPSINTGSTNSNHGAESNLQMTIFSDQPQSSAEHAQN